MDPAEKTTIEQRLVETGEKERLKEHLRTRLTESGWREELKLHAREVVRARGLNNIKHEDLVKEITPKGRALVPDVVKKELELGKLHMRFCLEIYAKYSISFLLNI